MKMKKDNIEEILIKELFSKFENNTGKNIGVEIEMPLIELDGKDINLDNLQKLFKYLVNNYEFKIDKIDNEGNCIAIKNNRYNDIISLEYSVNTLEFSLQEDANIYNMKTRFDFYYNTIEEFILKFNYKLIGSGINPNYKTINKKCLNEDRYLTIEKLLLGNPSNSVLYNQFCAYVCSTQTHITPNINELHEVINVFTNIEWVKSLLYSNSRMNELNSNMARDYLWQKSSFGKENTGKNIEYKSLDDIIENYKTRLIHYIERENKYYLIEKTNLSDFFKKEKLYGKDYDGSEMTIMPKIDDIKTFRSYKNIEITRMGTLEIRCDCTQKLENIFEIVAFNVGIFEMYRDVAKLIKQYNFDTQSIKNRILKQYNKKLNEKEKDFINILIETVIKGLKKRGKKEELLLNKINEMRVKNEKGGLVVL